nr:ribonuclease H-like domain-containing protein [Tanacetum cinerariifolium]
MTREIPPEAKDAFLIISREESHRGIPPSSVKAEKPQVSAFVARQTDNNNNRNRNWSYNKNNANRGNYDSLLCKNCGLKGHTIDRCFELIGYPPGFKRNPNLKPTNGFNNSKSNNVEVKKRSGGTSESKTSGSSTVSLTNEQVMKLMSFLNEKSCSTAQANMVGANQHITNSTKNMFNIVDVTELKLTVGHPNGTLAQITHVGSLGLNNDVVLFDVLVVPEYCVSLLSVHKLIKDIKLVVMFDECKCLVQDLRRGRVLGTGSEFGGLYVFDNDYNKSKKCVLIGYAGGKKAYKLFSLESRNVLYSRDVKFYETISPYKMSSIKTGFDNEKVSDVSSPFFFDFVESETTPKTSSPNDEEEGTSGRDGSMHQPDVESDGSRDNPVQKLITSQAGHDGEHTATPVEENTLSEGNIVPSLEVPVFQNVPEVQTEEVSLIRFKRSSKLPDKLNDYVLDKKVKSSEPSSFEEASNDINWINAMNEEMNALYKARVVAKGFNQKRGIDYDETFSPAVKMETVRCLINLALQQDWKLFQMDLNNAFLYEMSRFKEFLSNNFKIKDLGELKYFLGIEALRTKSGLCLNHRKYCLEMLHEYGLLACRPVMTPLPKNYVLSHNESNGDKYLRNITSYQKVIGKLKYLTMTRLDISYVVQSLSQHMHVPLQSHFDIGLVES